MLSPLYRCAHNSSFAVSKKYFFFLFLFLFLASPNISDDDAPEAEPLDPNVGGPVPGNLADAELKFRRNPIFLGPNAFSMYASACLLEREEYFADDEDEEEVLGDKPDPWKVFCGTEVRNGGAGRRYPGRYRTRVRATTRRKPAGLLARIHPVRPKRAAGVKTGEI